MGCSGSFLPPSPPAEKATACGDQTGKSGTGDRSGHRHGACGVYHDCAREVSLILAVADDMEHLGDRERIAWGDGAQIEVLIARCAAREADRPNAVAVRRAAAGIIVTEHGTVRADENLLDQCPSWHLKSWPF